MKAIWIGIRVCERQAIIVNIAISIILRPFTTLAIFMQAIDANPVLLMATANAPSKRYERAISELPPMPPINISIVAGMDIPAATPAATAAMSSARIIWRFMRQRTIITITETTTGFVMIRRNAPFD